MVTLERGYVDVEILSYSVVTDDDSLNCSGHNVTNPIGRFRKQNRYRNKAAIPIHTVGYM